MKIFGFITRRMAAKIFLVIGLVVGGAFLWQAHRETARAEQALRDETRAAATMVALSVKGSVESTMLQGDGILVKSLVERIKNRVAEADIHVYDPRGVEVFAAKGPVPDPASLPPPVARALVDGERRADSEAGILVPIANEERCAECHADGARLRGVLQVSFSGRCSERGRAAIAELVGNGFVHLMTAKRQDLLDEYFAELAKRSPAIAAVEVYDREGDGVYGTTIEALDAAEVTRALDPASDHAQRTVAIEGGSIELIPLPTQPRCRECHKDDEPVRGAVAVQLAPATDARACAEQDFETVVDTSLRYIMMSRLGGIACQFLDSAVATGVVDRLVLYDNVGRVFWDTRHLPPPMHVAAVLESGTDTATFVGSGDGERVRVVRPLPNEPECGQCHGNDFPLRGVVTVSLSTAKAAAMRDEQFRNRVWFTAYTLFGILFILIGLLQYLVVRPVKEVALVADAIGAGDLGRTVGRADPEGDELAQLGARINAMVGGLRAKLHLEKFVSRGAVQAAEGAGVSGVERKGVRRAATVLFSDIRGFTAFSEGVPAETVVAMLNRFLQAQADVVQRYDGDIDKFVGDELMAVFQGDDAEARAVQCGLDMIDAVHTARESALTVGVGISRGDVVYGAIGAAERMDFTVIGDAVNTGARLCSIALGDQVLVTEDVYRACDDLPGIEFAQVESKPLKGKKQLVAVFEASRVSTS